MNPEQRKSVEIRNTDPRRARTSDNSYGIDDIGLPEDITPDNAVEPDKIRPEQENRRARGIDVPREAAIPEVRPADNARTQQAEPDAPARHDSKLERAVRKMEPTGHQISDDELRDPGATTPDSPPTDNRS